MKSILVAVLIAFGTMTIVPDVSYAAPTTQTSKKKEVKKTKKKEVKKRTGIKRKFVSSKKKKAISN